jgi:hypothetical protein
MKNGIGKYRKTHNRVFSLWITEEQHEKLAEIKTVKGDRSMSDLCRKIFDEVISRYEESKKAA